MEVFNLNRKKTIILLSVVAMVAILSSFALTAYATEDGDEDSMMPKFRRLFEWRRQMRARGGHFGRVEVSEEFKANVISIAENDVDVQELLAQGYSVKGVRPILKSIVDADGDVTTKVTKAVVVLESEDGTSHAAVMVDLDEARVTKIVIITRTVIEK